MKTGGTSVTNSLQAVAKNEFDVENDQLFKSVSLINAPSDGNLQKHALPTDIRRAVGNQIWSECFKFSLVRHPYPRMVSLFTFIKRMVELGFPPTRRLDSDPPTKWPLTRAYLASKGFSDFIRQEELLYAAGFWPQTNWTHSAGQQVVDYVGRLEQMHKVFSAINNRTAGLKITARHDNRSSNTTWDQILTKPSDYRYIAHKFEEDFICYEYDPEIRKADQTDVG